jgi:hypothetical protein
MDSLHREEQTIKIYYVQFSWPIQLSRSNLTKAFPNRNGKSLQQPMSQNNLTKS